MMEVCTMMGAPNEVEHLSISTFQFEAVVVWKVSCLTSIAEKMAPFKTSREIFNPCKLFIVAIDECIADTRK
jgi:hypothetical protein